MSLKIKQTRGYKFCPLKDARKLHIGPDALEPDPDALKPKSSGGPDALNVMARMRLNAARMSLT